MINLYPFQAKAADQLAERIVGYQAEPITVTRGGQTYRVPFIQLLSSITASGKTIILADAVSSIAKQLPIKPVVLWLSKATVVVEQTYASLDAGGELHSIMDDFSVHPLADYDSRDVQEDDDPFLYFATVGTFNQRDKEAGSLKVFKSAIDDADQSTWESLKERLDSQSRRRPLIIVYDEAHNLSDQQTDLLLELEPDALLLATATQRVPQRISDDIIEVHQKLGGLSDKDLITQVDAMDVADSDLIKGTLELVGRQASMEQIVEEVVAELDQTSEEGQLLGLQGRPKAVYVCKTNVVEGSDQSDDPKQPFAQRQAPPILIWRQLTEKLGVDPADVAVYANLRVNKDYPLPDEFVLFNGGDRDYARFTRGDYHHIVFNQSLQEGWDDPLVYFAYVDKSMGSRVQAEQVVGRLLRQPGRRVYASDRLNSAQIFVRVESTGVFDDVVDAIQEKIRNGKVKIQLLRSPPGSPARTTYAPKERRVVPVSAIITQAAEQPIQDRLDQMADWRNDDGTNTEGVGRTTRVQKLVGEVGHERFEWKEVGHSARVLARWLFAREVRKIYPNALGVALTSNSDGSNSKFDAQIGLGSKAAAHVAEVARQVADAFVEYVYLKLRRPNPYVVGSLDQQAGLVEPFGNAIHDGYENLNPDEVLFARALDRTELPWCRNPPRSGYGIPLLRPGKTDNFFPDFLVWKDQNVYAIDTKGAHLHADAMRKLTQIRPAGEDTPRVFVRFVTPGVVDGEGAKRQSDGYTVSSFKPNGTPDFIFFDSIYDALDKCLQADV